MFITWNDSYSVKVPTMDEQHKALVDIINGLHEALESGKNRDIIENVINELIDYTRTHFSDEEKFMNEINFPDLDEHKKQHSLITNKIEQFQQDFTAGNISLSSSIMEFLWGWLLEHILVADKKYGEHFAKSPQPAR